MTRRIVLALWCGGLWACNTAVAVDPEGGACDPGNVCPSGFACVQGVCHASGATGGAGGGTGGGTGLCAGVSCSSPPASSCESASVAKSFTGTCEPSTGQCTYTPVQTTCAGGCQGGACLNLCTGQACTSPPGARCADANTLRTFSSPGQCVAASGLCTYPSTDVPCTNGCSNGACVGPSLSFSQTGPRLRFQGLAIDQAPGTATGTATDVLVVGLGGHVSRWNGSAWSDVATPSGTPTLRSVSFSSSTGAFVVGSGHTAWRYSSAPTPTVSAVASFVGGSANTTYVAVHARADNNVLIADY